MHYARDMLASPSSLGREPFSDTELDALLDERAHGAAVACIGYLLNAEAFRRLLLQARPRRLGDALLGRGELRGRPEQEPSRL